MSSVTFDPQTSLSALQDRLRTRLVRVRRAMRGRFVAEAVARVMSALLGVLALSLLLDWWLELSLVGRAGYAAVGLAGVGWVAWRFLVQPLMMSLGPLDVAAAIDRRESAAEQKVASRVASVLQLPEHLNQPRGSSPEMIEVAVRSNFAALEGVNFKQALSGRHLLASLAVAAVAVLIPVGFALAKPNATALWAERWLAGSDRPWPRDTSLEVVGVEEGRFIVPRGEPATLQVLVTDKEHETDVVHMRMRSDSGRDETVTLTRFEAGDFRYDLPPLQQDVRVQVWGGDGEAEPFVIVPVDRPRIIDLKLTATHPRLSEPTVHHFRGEEGTVRLLPETAAVLELTANVPVADIDVATTNGQQLEFERAGDDSFTARWTHKGAVQMRITLTSSEAGLVSHPRPVTIGERPDRAPRLSLRHSGVRQRITPTATVPLAITARDDFGVKSVSLDIQTPQLGIATEETAEEVTDAEVENGQSGETASGERAVYGPKDPTEETTVDENHAVDVAALGLSPGGVMTVQAVARDDCFTGSQRTESRKTVFRVVKPEELFKEILLRQQQLRSRLRKQYEAAIELRDEIRIASIPDDASKLLRTHQLIRREVGQVSTALDASALEMKLNKLGGPETWDLIEGSVLKPLRRLHGSEMELQRQALASLVTSSNAADEPPALEEIADQQQTIVDALKRILDNMAQWDSFIDVVNQLNTVIKLETRVRRQTEALRAKQVESIFD